MAERNQDHGGVALAEAIVFGCLDQPLDFGSGEILTFPNGGIRNPDRLRGALA